MTRDEFIEQVTVWSELIDFCNDYGCPVCDDVYDDDQMDDYLNDRLVDMAQGAWNWRDLRDELDDIPTGYYYYCLDDDGWTGLDEDFDAYKDDVIEWMDREEEWEDDEEEEYIAEEPAPSEDEGCETEDEEDVIEDFSITELVASCIHTVKEKEGVGVSEPDEPLSVLFFSA